MNFVINENPWTLKFDNFSHFRNVNHENVSVIICESPLKANDKFINLVDNFGIGKSDIVFKISTVKFLNNHSKIKKSSLSLHFSIAI